MGGCATLMLSPLMMRDQDWDYAPPPDRSVAEGAIFFVCVNAHIVDALHAVSALLHDSAAAHGDFRIAQKLQLRRFPILEAQEIKAAHLGGGVGRTI